MKNSNKSSIITGVVLLLLAALFSISLIVQFLDFGMVYPTHNNFFFLLGNLIYTVYGFSSILIPVFLFVAGLSCFSTTWTAKKTIFLLTAIIPFFTAVITENICRSIVSMGNNPFNAVKITITLVTGILLIVMEFLGESIVADKIDEKFFAKKKHQNDDDKTEKITKSENFLTKIKDKFSTQKNEENQIEENKNDDDFSLKFEDETQNIQDEKISNSEKNLTPFDDISFVTDEDLEISEEELRKQEIELGLRSPDENEISENHLEEKTEEIEETNLENDKTQTSENEKSQQQNNEFENSSESESEIENPATIISQEEFAALTNFDDENFEEENQNDELEWNNLPPKPEKLPPEYEDSIEFDDSALDFPPKDEEISEENNSDENFTSFSEEEYDLTKPNINENVETEDSPYSSTRYIDSVVENPSYPHTISLVDEDENPFEEEPILEEKKTPEPKKSKFPVKISFDENDEENNFSEFSPITKNSQFENLEKNINLKEDFSPEVEDESPVFNQIEEQENIYEKNDEFETEKKSNLENNIVKTETKSSSNENSSKISENDNNVGFSFAASNVFSNMEKDIRESIPVSEIQPLTTENIKPQSANNLTADELTDFFNAQQEENTPKTTTIAPNPPKIGNRAMKKGPYIIPSDLLIAYKDDQYWLIDDATKDASLKLKQTLAEFNIEAQIIGIKKGPVVTMFEILPAPGVKLSKIVALQDNIALSLAAQSVRIVAPIPGKQAVGIEVPNKHRSVVGFREIIEMNLPEWEKMSIPVVLGKDILGKAQLIDLAKTPHMLIAGATGSGKSVCVNSLILSILYKRSPFDVKLVLVDPKVVELKLYNNIPHLLTPVITEPKKALQSLQWCLCEMERRYALLDSMGVRDISNYNLKIKNQNIATEKLPYIVVIIDEFADLMATSGKELENVIARLTAMSRAVGIHLVLATQRPSVNVITGLIKANIPTRIAFMVASRTDSNIIIDTVGAEKLLGRGDMLYASASDPAPIRIQGTFVTDQEVENVVKSVKDYGEPDYIDDEMFSDDDDERGTDLFGQPMDDDDPLYDQALEIVVQAGKASASYLQRRLSIGYNRAARLVEEMEERGIVGPANGSKPREIIHIP